ncbi:hypothetical protein [Noviherbaspirillum aerium]|uniref:hypothetical protein n=1 Tax=Noviherbaspirillum aerium TaxID=2588497 RepID=UPI00124DE4BD|nr:hypothetical protein [Noviherbaspirillum aerium]
MKTTMRLALLLGVAALCANAHASENGRTKARKMTTNEKLEQLTERQHAIVQWQEQQQRQLQEMTQRMNAVRAAAVAGQSPAYSYP